MVNLLSRTSKIMRQVPLHAAIDVTSAKTIKITNEGEMIKPTIGAKTISTFIWNSGLSGQPTMQPSSSPSSTSTPTGTPSKAPSRYPSSSLTRLFIDKQLDPEDIYDQMQSCG
jgi:hypothetical protein